jgi:DNA-binding transcriptional LysR family regulator
MRLKIFGFQGRLGKLVVMNLNSSQLEAFFTIAKVLNFTRAAELLHVTQSALSQRIAKLEAELETTLFIRDRSALRLTEAGEQLLRFCQLNSQAESELLSKLKNTKDELAGALRIGGFSSVNRSLVIPALKKMLVENPKMTLHLMTREVRELAQLLRSAEVDYIFTSMGSDSEEIESRLLGLEENVLVQSKKCPGSEIFLDHDEMDPTTKAYFSVNKIRYKPENMRYLDDVYGLFDGVKNGLGKAVLPLHLIAGDVGVEVINPLRKLLVPVYLNFYKQPYYRKAHSIFVEAVSDHFKHHLSQQN